jgi:hypothetical protein
MATAQPRVFISFDFDNDSNMKDLFVGQKDNPKTPFNFSDWSSKEHLTGDWKAKIKAKLAYVDVVCVLCGKNMNTATGVDHEIEMAKELGKPYFLLALYDPGSNKPNAASGDKLYKWTWDNLEKLIHGGR